MCQPKEQKNQNKSQGERLDHILKILGKKSSLRGSFINSTLSSLLTGWEGSRYSMYYHVQYRESLPPCLMYLPDTVGRAIITGNPAVILAVEWTDSRSKQQQLLQWVKNPQDLRMNSTSMEKNCWRKTASVLGFFFVPTLGKAEKCPVSVAAKSSPGQGNSWAATHTCSQAWELRDAQAGTRHSQKHCSSSSHSHQEAQKTGPHRTCDTAWERVTLGQSNSVSSKGASTGLQKCFKYSLHPEKERVWKTAEDRNDSVLWQTWTSPSSPRKIPNPFVRGQSTKFCLLLALLFIVA